MISLVFLLKQVYYYAFKAQSKYLVLYATRFGT